MTDFAGPPKPEPAPDEFEADHAPIDAPADEVPAPPTEPRSPEPAEPLSPESAEPPSPAPPAELPSPGPSVESTRRLLGASFDLLTKASDDMRRASFYIGLIVLGTVGPFALATFAIEVVSIHRTAAEMDHLQRAGLEAWLGLLVSLAFFIGLLVAAVESRAVAAAILGAQFAGRPITVRQALARSRMTFWYVLAASLIVGIPVSIAQAVLGGVFAAVLGEQTDVSLITSALVAALVGAPLAYLLTGVVLGDVDPGEATRRSFRVFRARRPAAALIAIFETTAVLLVVLGLGAGLDLALRVFDGLGLSLDSGPAGLILIALGLIVGVFALGTLIYTALAISIAPQVVMFVGLTHATFGLDHVRPGGDRDPDQPGRPGRRPFHWLTWPMRIVFGLGVLGLVGVLAILSALIRAVSRSRGPPGGRRRCPGGGPARG